MRTTLELDDTVLSAARAKAAADGTSLGRAVSELARRGLLSNGQDPSAAPVPSGFPVLRGIPGRRVTPELVAENLEDD